MEGRWSGATKQHRASPRRLCQRGTDDVVDASCAQRRGSRAVGRRRAAASSGLQVERKVRELRRLVPGGRELGNDQLLSRTADYIFELRMQLHVLRLLSKLYVP